jgi:DNA polymerase III epsilon subunit family exonuclease
VETTGFNNDIDDIIELGAVKVYSSKIVEEFSVLVKSSKPVSPKISELTGITQIMLDENGVELGVALRSFLEFVGVLPCIAHNVSFDYGFIRAACARCKMKIFANRQFDTLTISKKLIPNIRDRKLKTLAEYFCIDELQSHRSLHDCRLTVQVFERLKELKQKDGDGS